jgi:PAS domain S-box-containing protein
LDSQLVPIKNTSGIVEKVLSTSRNITDRKQAEESLARTVEEWKTTFDSTNDAIWILDKDQRILRSNKTAEKLFNCTSQDIIGNHCWDIIHSTTEAIPECPFTYSKQSLKRETMELQMGDRIFQVTVDPILENEDDYLGAVHIISDITELKEREKETQANLKGKETLLQEIHHRVKNNMQVISSLLNLQAHSTVDDKVKDALKESQSRVHAMSALHEALYGSDNLAQIDFKNYLSSITQSLSQTYNVDPGQVRLNIESDNVLLNMKIASPLGLTINELVSNSLKYAFPEKNNNQININAKLSDEKDLEIVVNDNGVGMPKDFDWRKTDTLGLQLVRDLIEKQLKGSVDMESKNGTKFTIKFNIEA